MKVPKATQGYNSQILGSHVSPTILVMRSFELSVFVALSPKRSIMAHSFPRWVHNPIPWYRRDHGFEAAAYRFGVTKN